MAPPATRAPSAKSNKTTSGWGDARSDANSTQVQHVPFQESHTWQCNKEGCEQLFETEKGMRRHKKYSPDHFYCYRCDVDCKDWVDLTNHKVEMMRPYLEGRIQMTEADMPKHVVCEFCGEDFKSFGGRKLHRRQVHPADQDVECPGCKSHFIRAAHMIDHIENEGCSKIRRSDLYRSIYHKYVVKQILKDPEPFRQPTGAVTDGSEAQDQEDGGVSLLDHEDEAQLAGFDPLPAAAQGRGLGSPDPSHASVGTWPGLPSQASLADSMRRMSITSNTQSGTLAPHRIPQQGPYPYARAANASLGGQETASNTSKPSAWNNSTSASRALFPYAEPTPPQAGDWSAVLAQREGDVLAQDNGNMLKARWWDPSSRDYNPNFFWDDGMGVYTCRFADCVGGSMAFHALVDLQEHIKVAHLPDHFQCPNCFKRFYKASALVAHAESTQKCNVRASGKFKSMIDEISGGLLDARPVAMPKIYRPDTAVVKFGDRQPAPGVMDTKFKGKPAES